MRWTHLMCDRCWDRIAGPRVAVRVHDGELSPCCFCGEATASGIYVRADPKVYANDRIHRLAREIPKLLVSRSTGHPRRWRR